MYNDQHIYEHNEGDDDDDEEEEKNEKNPNKKQNKKHNLSPLEIAKRDHEDAIPFFITVAYNAPHNPLQALKSDFESEDIVETFERNTTEYRPRGAKKHLDKKAYHTGMVNFSMYFY